MNSWVTELNVVSTSHTFCFLLFSATLHFLHCIFFYSLYSSDWGTVLHPNEVNYVRLYPSSLPAGENFACWGSYISGLRKLPLISTFAFHWWVTLFFPPVKANLSCCFGTNTLQLQSYSLAMNSMHFYLQRTSHILLSCDRSELHRITGDGTVPFCAEKSLRRKLHDPTSREVGKSNGTIFHGSAQRQVFASEELERKLKH